MSEMLNRIWSVLRGRHVHDWYRVYTGWAMPEYHCTGCNAQQFRLGNLGPGQSKVLR